MTSGRILLGSFGLLLTLASPGVWRRALLVGPRVQRLNSGQLYVSFAFATPDQISGPKREQMARLAKVRAAILASVGSAFAAGLFFDGVYGHDLVAARLVGGGLVRSIVLAAGVYFAATGLAGVILGRNRGAWLTIPLGRRYLTLRYNMPRRAHVEPPTESERFIREGVPADPVEEAGQQLLQATVPSRIGALYLLVAGGVFVAAALGLPGVALGQGLFDSAGAVVWVGGIAVLIRTLFSEQAGAALRAGFWSVVGLGVCSLVGLTPGPIEAFHTVHGWIV
jgi:hypothetical protein